MTIPGSPVVPVARSRRGPIAFLLTLMVVVGLITALAVTLILSGDDDTSPQAGVSTETSQSPLPAPVLVVPTRTTEPAPTATTATEETPAESDKAVEEEPENEPAAAPPPDSPEDINLAQVCLERHGIGRFGYKHQDAYSVVCLKTSRTRHSLGKPQYQEYCDTYMGLETAKAPNGRDWQCGSRQVNMTDLCRKRYLDIPDVNAVEPPYGSKKAAQHWGCSVPKIVGPLTQDDLDEYCKENDYPRSSPGDPSDPLTWACWP